MYAESIYICGVARHCAAYLPRAIENAATVGRLFSHFHIIIAVADDAHDDREILIGHRLTGEGRLTTITVTRDPAQPRTVNIARARNTTLAAMRAHAHAQAHVPTHYIMMDCDDVCADPINLRTFMAAYNQRREWDVITFAPEPYYDLWALAAPPFVFSYSNFAGGRDVYAAHIARLLEHPCGRPEGRVPQSGMPPLQHPCGRPEGRVPKDGTPPLQQTPKGGIVPVWSAFCGFGIYKWAMSEGAYDGRYRMDYIPAAVLSRNIIAMGGPIRRAPHPAIPFGELDADCEHRAFHLTAVFKRGARVGIFNGVLFGGGGGSGSATTTAKKGVKTSRHT